MAGRVSGDWLLVEELFERGDPAFVDALRQFDDADVLGKLAERWFTDSRPEARRLLLDYLDRPLNAFRHEALVKRLFKKAEAAGDDEVMGSFLVAFDRSIRRVRKKRYHHESQTLETEREANALAAVWRNQGLEAVNVWPNWRKQYHVFGRWVEPFIASASDTVMPRGKPSQVYGLDPKTQRYRVFNVPDWVVKLKLDPARFERGGSVPAESRRKLEERRLFSVGTRNYLRRRAWRYFRRLGRQHPERYVAAAVRLLVKYRDDDVTNALAQLDNWGLMHVLFRHSPCLTRDDRAFYVADGHTLAELEPAPAFEALWDAVPRAHVDLLVGARCRTVRVWAAKRIRRNLEAAAAVFPLEERLALLGHDDPEVVALAAELLRGDPRLASIPLGRWLELIETASPAALDVLGETMTRWVDPSQVTLAEAARLAAARPLPVARLGLTWLQGKTPVSLDDCRVLLALADAGSDAIRPELLRWVSTVLGQAEFFEPAWVLEWLDSRHADVRAAGWSWFQADPRLADEVMLWQRLMESPYDDVRIALVADLEARSRRGTGASAARGDLDGALLGWLWASVLLNVNRGGRAKPAVLRQVVARLESRPAEFPRLLPLLAAALRSHRGPEWRAGLAAVVRLAERDDEAAALVRQEFPDLRWVEAASTS